MAPVNWDELRLGAWFCTLAPMLGRRSPVPRVRSCAPIAKSANDPKRRCLRPRLPRVDVARPAMQVRPMQPSDVNFVDALAARTGFLLDIEAECARDFAHLWVARVDVASVEPDAFLLAWTAADELHVIAIGTRPSQRRRGLARQLVTALLEFGRTRGTRLVILEVRRSNRAALGLYRGLGFSVSRLRCNYYANPNEDGIEMQLAYDDHGNIVPTLDEIPWLEVSECLR